MIITKDNVVDLLLQDNLIVQSYVYSDKSAKYWKILKPLTIELSNGVVINIPEGFYYDMSTSPKWAWSFLRPYNDGLLGYLIHDYLYVHQEAHNLTQWQADDEMLFWTNLTNSNKFDNCVRHLGVKYIFGWWYWYKMSRRISKLFQKIVSSLKIVKHG